MEEGGGTWSVILNKVLGFCRDLIELTLVTIFQGISLTHFSWFKQICRLKYKIQIHFNKLAFREGQKLKS